MTEMGLLGQRDEATTAMPRPAELVRRLLDADAHHDLAGYRALLADEFTERTEGEVTSRRGDDGRLHRCRSWALAQVPIARIDESTRRPAASPCATG